MNHLFYLLFVVVIFIYIWLSDIILLKWLKYKKYIQSILIIISIIILYKNPESMLKIIKNIIKINNIKQPPIILHNIYDNIRNKNPINSINNSKSIHKRNVTNLQKKVVAANQKWLCGMCQNTLDASYEIDHIKPLYKGGSNNNDNLMALCRNCHGKKTINDSIIN